MKFLKFVNILVVATILSGCYDSDIATAALTDSGYTKIRITGFNPKNCHFSSVVSTGFEARDVSGLPVNGSVCSDAFDSRFYINETKGLEENDW